MLTIHKASAGSGKTYTLTYTYIKLLLGEKSQINGSYALAPDSDRNRHRAILAITFTNKATEEMKQRIVARLSELADGRECAFRKNLCDDLHCSEQQLQQRANRALSELLADFGQFNVSTIDSFFQTVLRTFAREVNLQGGYDIELDENHATFVGVSQMLASINRTDSDSEQQRRHVALLTSWLESYMNYRIASGKAFNIFVRHSNINSDLVKFIKDSINEVYKLNSKLISEYMADFGRIAGFSKSLTQQLDSLKEQMYESGEQAKAIITANGLDSKLSSTVVADIDRWCDGTYTITATTRNAIVDENKRYKKNFRNEAGSDADNRLIALLAPMPERIRLYGFYSYILGRMYYLGLIGEAERFAEMYLRENNAILLSSTNTILRAIINDEETPFIYERMGVRLRHFLIDEFQDTSRLQWLNLRPLLKESLATDADNLIIGDEKQAIYRFRNSDPDLIATDVPADFATQSEIHGDKPSENTNWRSSGVIVRFNNTLFSVLSSTLNADSIYSNIAQQIKFNELPGFVELFPYDTDPDTSLGHMVEAICRQLRSGYRQRNIAILVNKRSEGLRVVDYLLRSAPENPELAQLKIITEEALRISASPVIERITGVMRYIDAHQTVDHKKAGTVTTNELIAMINNRYQFYLAGGMDQETALTKAFETTDTEAEKLAVEAATMNCFNLSSAVERIISRFITADEQQQHNIYLSAFLDQISDFCANNAASLHSFMKWWDETGCTLSLAVPSDIDAISVMTIHKSKGLEYPCVHIPFADWPMKKANRINWFDINTPDNGCIPEFSVPGFNTADVPPLIPMEPSQIFAGTSLEPQYNRIVQEEIVDNLNKTYVAFTRASRELIVGYKYNPPKKKAADSIAHIGLQIFEAIGIANQAFVDTRIAEAGLSADMLAELSTYIGSDGLFVMGEPTFPSDEKTDENRITVTTTVMPPFSSSDNEQIWKMNQIEDMDMMQLPRRQGIIYHTVMSRIRHASDLERAVRQVVADGLIDNGEGDMLVAKLRQALAGEKSAQWFNGFKRLLNERTLCSFNFKNKKVCHHRPDRVVWCADGSIHVVDYKFGNEEPPKYIRQVRYYMSLINRLYPGVEVKGWLWWPIQDKYIEITPR